MRPKGCAPSPLFDGERARVRGRSPRRRCSATLPLPVTLSPQGGRGPAADARMLHVANAIGIGHRIRHRHERRQRRRQRHRTRTRPAAAMRRRERLVQIDVHGIDAEIARPHLADDGVEVGAVRIEEGARRMHRVGNRHHVALEQPAGVGVGQHDRRHVRRQPLRSPPPDRRCRRRAPAPSRRDSPAAPPSPGWCRAPTPAPAPPSASRRAPRSPP